MGNTFCHLIVNQSVLLTLLALFWGVEGDDIKKRDDSNWKRAQSGSFCYLTLSQRIRLTAFLKVQEIGLIN